MARVLSRVQPDFRIVLDGSPAGLPAAGLFDGLRSRRRVPGEGLRSAGQVRAPRRELAACHPGAAIGADRELELLVLQLPVVTPDDTERDDVVALRAAILGLVTEINIGLADPD